MLGFGLEWSYEGPAAGAAAAAAVGALVGALGSQALLAVVCWALLCPTMTC